MIKDDYCEKIKFECENKRFKFIKGFQPSIFVDMKTGIHYNCEEISDLLNYLSEENKQMQKNFDDLIQWLCDIAERNITLNDRMAKLQRENYKLKQRK